MILATLIFNFFRSFLFIFMYVASSPWYIFKMSLLWFFVALTVSYAYFLWTHQGYIIEIRKNLIVLLAKSVGVGLLCSVALIGVYEFILQMLCASKFFFATRNQICAISLLANPLKLFQAIAFCEILFSSFWACVYVEPFLQKLYANRIVHGYHWLIIGITVLCLGFLALIAA